MRAIRIVCAGLLLISLGTKAADDAGRAGAPLTIARNHQVLLDVVVGAEAADTTRGAAADLTDYLGRITGGDVAMKTGTGTAGIVVGVPSDFPSVPVPHDFEPGPFHRDDYRLKTTDKALYLLGATPTAVEFAVWDLLHRLGYRYYFPSERWEIIPKHATVTLTLNEYERPDYINRSGPRGGIRHGHRPWIQDPWRHWKTRNRTKSSFALRTGHAYGGIIRHHKAAFDAHPEYLGLVDGKRGGSKFCIANEELRALIVRNAVDQIEADPQRDSISLDPSDGGGWCACERCRRMGSVSDRVVLLANQAAEAINKLGFGEKFVGMYAYNVHSPPPSVTVHPTVIVSLATAFIQGNQTFDEMLAGWSKKTERIGIREYYGVPIWNSSMPGWARAGRLDYIERTIPKFFEAGARFMNAESDDAWGPNGLGYYLASRLLWDADESAEEIADDFFERCFGNARTPMREFYEFITSRPRQSEHMVGRMYRLLRAARGTAEDPPVINRIDDLVLYTRYVELHRRWAEAPKKRRQAAFDELARFIWRSRKHVMCDSHGLFYYLNRNQRKSEHVSWTPGEKQSRVAPPERLKTGGDKPFAEAEIVAFIEEGIDSHDVLAFEPRSYSGDLVPAATLELAGDDALGRHPYAARTRGRAVNYTWIDDPPATLTLQVTTGLIYNNKGDATVELAHWQDGEFRVVARKEIPPDEEPHEVALAATERGLHRVVWDESRTGTRVEWPEAFRWTIPSSLEHANHMWGRDSWFFYVPKGTEVVGAYAGAKAGSLHNAEGKVVLNFGETPKGYVSVDVPEGQDGRLWSVRRMAGSFLLMTVPPYGAPSAKDLLLPLEVVERDSQK